MKQTILYAYLVLMLAVGLPFLANLGTPDSPGGTNPTPSAAVDEASGPETQLPSAPDTLLVLLPDGRTEEQDMQSYLTGVVAAEMPADFHIEALKAQAVAARSYAMYCAAHARHGEAQEIPMNATKSLYAARWNTPAGNILPSEASRSSRHFIRPPPRAPRTAPTCGTRCRISSACPAPRRSGTCPTT